MSAPVRTVPFAAAPFFMLRTPLLPFDAWLALSHDLVAPGAGDDASILADAERIRGELRTLVERRDVREALFVASPDVHEAVDLWLSDPLSERGQKAERTIVRYVSRMAGRCTPFGLFAGCSLGTVGDETLLRVPPAARARRHSRLDIDYLFRLTSSLIADRELLRELVVRPNSSLYRAGGRLRYTRSQIVDDARAYQLVGVEDDPALQAIVQQAAAGARLHALAESLVAHAGVSLEEATEYLHALVDAGLLVADLTPAVTGPEPIQELIETLAPIRPALAAALREASRLLDEIDARPLGEGVAGYRKVAETLRALPAEVGTGELFQVDLVKPACDAILGAEVVREIADAVAVLHAVGPTPADGLLRQFRDKFLERYETAEVPLVEALDEESGVGYGEPAQLRSESTAILKGIKFDGEPPVERQVAWGARESFILRKLEEAARRGADELVLTPAELMPLAGDPTTPMPDAFAVQATVEAESESAIAQGRFRVRLGVVWGPSGARMFGRFCHGDAKLREQVVAHLRAEEQLRNDAIFAEVVHLPPTRIGNVLLRPVLREWELPFLGRSGAPRDRQLPITDLLVSVRDQRVVLRSARLGREIVPRMTTAHNYLAAPNLNIYRFLCGLQDQGVVSRASWKWGPLSNAAFLPRVVVGRTVVARASWNLDGRTLRSLALDTIGDRFRAVQSLRVTVRLPRFVAVEDDDHVLPFDLDNVLSVETLVHLVRKRSGLRLVEMSTPEQLCASGSDGRFVHEVVVPFIRSAPLARPSAPIGPRPPAEPVTRVFAPGSEWLYAKIYCGSNTADEILRDALSGVAGSAIRSNAADQWFFLRYWDPDAHVRVRFHGEPARLHAEVLPALHAALAPFLEQGLVSRLQLDTYRREIERYGGPAGIALSEGLFHADSDAALAMLAELDGDEARWRCALIAVDRLLDDFGLELGARQRVVVGQRDYLRRELDGGVQHARTVGEKFRRERAVFESMLGPSATTAARLFASGHLEARSARLAPIVGELRRRAGAGRLSVGLEALVPSYIHMSVNRLLRTTIRAQELVLYDFLARLYESQAARLRGRARTPGAVEHGRNARY